MAIGGLFTILLVLISGYVAQQLHSVGQGWQIVLGLGVGTGAVYILRWYWWRINAWSEISAMVVAAVVARLSAQASSRRRSCDVCQDFIDYGRNYNRGVDRGHFSYSCGIRRKAAGVLPSRATDGAWLEADCRAGAGDPAGTRRQQQRF